MREMLSGAELGRRLGISKQAVSKAARAGRLRVAGRDGQGRPLYNFEEASQTFLVDPGQVDRKILGEDEGGRPPASGGCPAPAKPVAPVHVVDHGDGKERIIEARARKLAAEAALREIQLRLKNGELIEAKQARQDGVELGGILLGALQAWPARLAPCLAGLGADEFSIHNYLTEEVNNLIITIRQRLGLDQGLAEDSRADGGEG